MPLPHTVCRLIISACTRSSVSHGNGMGGVWTEQRPSDVGGQCRRAPLITHVYNWVRLGDGAVSGGGPWR